MALLYIHRYKVDSPAPRSCTLVFSNVWNVTDSIGFNGMNEFNDFNDVSL